VVILELIHAKNPDVATGNGGLGLDPGEGA
jgi:hypothetical protein